MANAKIPEEGATAQEITNQVYAHKPAELGGISTFKKAVKLDNELELKF
ncbi:hypothetical protein ACQKNX_22350 [Lysinibacillus sp. NPDC093712]